MSGRHVGTGSIILRAVMVSGNEVGRIPFLSWYESRPLSDGFHGIKQRLAAWGANTI
ncbi:MAG TPA: hypothetical protein PKG69_05360 [Methanoregulaceae archaeon]|nr:hypothetical protein [Methanoregulaceae archaeon]